MTKQELRQYVKAQKRRQQADLLAEMSAEICRRVCLSAHWQEAGTLLLYYPLPDEVDVRRLIGDAFDEGKRVFLPVVTGDDLELRLYEGETSLREGAFGIQEPIGPVLPLECYSKVDLAIVPGMAFDKCGHRLGRGKGYYDRLLPRLTRSHLQGVCFPFQFLDDVPAEPHDIPVHEVIFAVKNEE